MEDYSVYSLEDISKRLYGYDAIDSASSMSPTSCRVYETEEVVLAVNLPPYHTTTTSHGIAYSQGTVLGVMTNSYTERSHRTKIVQVLYINETNIVTASLDGGINMWSLNEDGVIMWKNYLTGSRNNLTAIDVTSSNEDTGSIVATTKDGYLCVWSRETLLPILSSAQANSPCLDSKGLYSVQLFETAQLLVAGGYGRIYVHEDSAAGEYSHVTTLGGHRGPVLSITCHSLSKKFNSEQIKLEKDENKILVKDLIISGGEDKTIIVWDVRMFREYARNNSAHSSAINTLTVLDPNSVDLYSFPLLISGSRDGLIRLWNLPSLTPVHEIKAHQGIVLQVSASLTYARFENKPAIVSTGSDNKIKVWKIFKFFNWERRKLFAMFLACHGFIKSSVFSDTMFSSMTLHEEVEEKGEVISSSELSLSPGSNGVEGSLVFNHDNSVGRVFYDKFMCKEICSFL